MRLNTPHLQLAIDPARGGKVTAITPARTGRNLLLAEESGAGLPLGDGTVFTVSGWDEAVPTVAASAGAPELGHAWRTAAQCRMEGARLVADWTLPGWEMARVITAHAEGLLAEYRITNTGAAPAPLLWAAHVLLPLAGLRDAALPGGEPRPGPGCDLTDLAARLTGGPAGWQVRDLSDRGASWKFFLPADRPVVLRYTDATLTFTTDAPWWGIWLNEGNFCGLHCLGVEPTNAPSDYLADAETRLTPGAAYQASWRLQVT